MFLKLDIFSGCLNVTVLNTQIKEIRLWEPENSWGWYALFFQLSLDTTEIVQTIRRASREWTKDGPSFFVLQPGESKEMHFNIKDGWWELKKDFLSIKDKPIYIRAVLEIRHTPEAEETGVFTGTVYSDWILTKPPYDWLFEGT